MHPNTTFLGRVLIVVWSQPLKMSDGKMADTRLKVARYFSV
jgi:hypothetical protein